MKSKSILFSLLIIALFKHSTSIPLRKEFILSCTYVEQLTTNPVNDVVTLFCYDSDVPTNKVFPQQVSAYLDCSNKRKANGYQVGNILFKNCQMSRIKYNISTVFTQFHMLNVSGIELQSLPSSFFTGAKFLKTLIASNNRLLEIPSSQFAQCPQLTDVDMSYNKISRVDGDAFNGVSITMRKLNLSHNHLTELHPNFFTKLARLETLDLSYNTIEHLVPFANLSKLVYLNLSFNSIKDLPDTMILSQPNLRFLQLSHNNFTLLKMETFAKQQRLHSLDLSYNSIKRMDFNSTRMDYLEQFHINNNQLVDLDGFKNLIFPILNSFAISGNLFNCSYLKTFLDSFDYHSSLSVLHHTNSTHIQDTEHDGVLQVHGVGCFNSSRNTLSTLLVVQSTSSIPMSGSDDVSTTKSTINHYHNEATTESNAQYDENKLIPTVSLHKTSLNAVMTTDATTTTTVPSNSNLVLLIVMCGLVVLNAVVMIFMIIRNRKLTSPTSTTTRYNCAFNQENGTKFSNVALENEYETIVTGGKTYEESSVMKC